ncbi:MAG: histidinol dehydrogenase [Candidatus Omnitrophica bacterium]|nr:histidinol dehydrogenase [Candidatus Omnitrophota bacterium]
MEIIRFTSKKLEKIYNRAILKNRKKIEEKVKNILNDIRLYGDEALIKYTKKFDRVKLTPRQLRVSESEISSAYQNINPELVSTLKIVIENINRFYRKEIKKSWKIKDSEGIILGESYLPLESVGIYIPAGQAPLVSTVYMAVLPAKIAGVERIVLVSPPDQNGNVNPYILVMANLLKVNEIYKVGGAQAIGALAFGTKTIPKVDKIVGPGNAYVTEAKRQVYGFVDIDMVAGPTELVIIANRFSNPKYIIADLKGQAEHAGSLPILITNSKALAKEVKMKIDSQGYIILSRNLRQAIDIANRIAPEHLEILVSNPKRWLRYVRNAGAVFLGPYSPVAVGDYVAGPSHVLPTNGTARFFSGLGISDFIKSMHIIGYTKKGLERVKEPLEKIIALEGFKEHLNSVKVRFE